MTERLATIVTLVTMLTVPVRSAADAPLGSKAHAVFEDAEVRFKPPEETWFTETQAALAKEVERVGAVLESQGREYADAWKTHLHWDLLTRNLGPRETVKLAELEIARRWLFSNKEGLEGPLFAPLRDAMEAHLDAAFTFSLADLRAAFEEKVAQAREQIIALEDEPSDANAAALARTLGWLERTRQLEVEVGEVRRLLMRPNAQVAIAEPLVRRIMSAQNTNVTETIPVSDRVVVEPTRSYQRERIMRVWGTATTEGRVELELRPNDEVAEVALVYNGNVHSLCHGVTGPVSFRIVATGTADAVKSVTVGRDGLELGDAIVTPHVRSRVTRVSSDMELAKRVGERRVGEPEALSLMNREANQATVENFRPRYDLRVTEAIDKLRADIKRMRESTGEFSDALAPLAREGARPYFDGARSTANEILLNSYARRRDQFGAAGDCPIDSIQGDILVRIHTSFVNNMAETITGGKTLSDEFYMRYAKIIHAELPLPLMVHSRAQRWATRMARRRPIELVLPGDNRFTFTVRIDAVLIDGVEFAAPTTAEIDYKLTRNEFGDYQLEREGGVAMESELPAEASALVHEKLDAFFGPLLNGGGVVMPEGGMLGSLQKLQSSGVVAEREWIVAGINVPTEVIDEITQRMEAEGKTDAPDEASTDGVTSARPAPALPAGESEPERDAG